MTKPIEETWDVETIYDIGAVENLSSDGQNDARRAMAACAPEALRMLLDMEYAAGGTECDEGTTHSSTCVWCGSYEPVPHNEDCPWLLLMRKAGLR